ncbi:condensation domain-containing protein, partial [Pseudoduganella namucuonensis]
DMLIRWSLLRLSPGEHVLLLTMHHIVSDGWSMGVLLRELTALYAAFAAGRPSPLAPLPLQYADFAHWQRQWLTGDVQRRQLDYWTAQLAGAPTLLELPTDRPRPPVQRHRGATLSFTVDAATTGALYELGRRARTTLFVTLTAAFQALLHRYSGQRDICIGAPIANRNRGEIEDLIGFFVNTLVLRARVDGAAPFADLLAQAHATALDAYAHQDLPLDQLVEALKPERHLSHAPLFQVVLALQNAPTGERELPGVRVDTAITDTGSARFDLLLNVTETAGRLDCAFEYNTDLFDAATIERLRGHWLRLLQAVAADPDTPVGLLPLLDDGERHHQLVEWNDTAAPYPSSHDVHQLFEAQAARTPDGAALAWDGGTVSYAELNARANRLARRLLRHSAAPDTRVALCLERGTDLIVALLAILKAGAAYVPLDPAYPAARLAHMLADAART